jgi:signal transduction histidine kinase/HD-like signal output (HDOD) protein
LDHNEQKPLATKIAALGHKARMSVGTAENNPKKIELSGIHCQPEALSLLLDACNREDGDLAPAAAAASLDAGLTAMLFDAAFTESDHSARKFIPLVDVLTDLGHAAIRTIAVHAAVGHVFSQTSESGEFDSRQFSLKALRGAHFAQLLAQKTGYPNPQEAYYCGLLRDVGQLVLVTTYAHEYTSIVGRVQSVSELMAAEKHRFGITHVDIAGHLISRWRLTSFMSDGVFYQHHSLEAVQGAHPLVRIVNLSTHLANRAGKLSDPQFDHARSLFGLTTAHLKEIADEADRATDRAMRELFLEGPVEGRDSDVMKERRYAHLARHVRTFALLAAASRHASTSSPRDGALIALAEQCRVAFGFHLPVAFLLDGAKHCLIGHPLTGQTELIGQLEIPLQYGRSLVMDSLQAGRPLHSFDVGLHAWHSVIDEQLSRLTGGSGILCLPLAHRGIRIGVVVIGIEESDLAKIQSEAASLAAFAAQAAQTIAALPVDKEVDTAADAIWISRMQLRKVIHEVNNPLGIMKNYIKILRLKMTQEDPAQFGLGVIDEEIDRVARIVGSLADAAETANAPEEPLNINLLIFDLVRITNEPLMIHDNIRLKTELDHAVKPLRCDKNKLKQVLVNLIKNAAESMPGGGEIVISTRDRVKLNGSEHVEIDVADSGPGLPAHVLEHLSEPVVSSKEGEHYGLGLSIVHGLIDELGGTIRCKSDSKNGTRFQILLPSALS